MTVARARLSPDLVTSRMIRGGWQLSGGHGDVDRVRAVDDMSAFLDRGVTNFDCADIYTGVEDMYGAFRQRLVATRGVDAARAFKVHTKFVPDWHDLGRIDQRYVTAIIDRSLQRLQVDRLDLVQFHWWNYDAPGMIETASFLQELQRVGKIAHLAGTNFDTARTASLLDAGVPLISMQIQYSMLDTRPELGLVDVALRRSMALLCYGTLAGGFLTKFWLDQPEPTDGLVNRSLIKYKLVIDDFGGWELFQKLLRTLDGIAAKHSVSIASVATRWVLDRPAVAAVIVGARYASRLDDVLGMFELTLDADDTGAIAAVLERRRGPEGDTFELERDRTGRHGRIMKYDLNKT